MLEKIMFVLFFAIGVGVGAGIMYVFELYQDWKEDKEEEKNRIQESSGTLYVVKIDEELFNEHIKEEKI